MPSQAIHNTIPQVGGAAYGRLGCIPRCAKILESRRGRVGKVIEIGIFNFTHCNPPVFRARGGTAVSSASTRKAITFRLSIGLPMQPSIKIARRYKPAGDFLNPQQHLGAGHVAALPPVFHGSLGNRQPSRQIARCGAAHCHPSGELHLCALRDFLVDTTFYARMVVCVKRKIEVQK